MVVPILKQLKIYQLFGLLIPEGLNQSTDSVIKNHIIITIHDE